MDSFGTEAQFNYNLYKEKIAGGSMGPFGRHNLNLQQYQTMFRKYSKPDQKKKKSNLLHFSLLSWDKEGDSIFHILQSFVPLIKQLTLQESTAL